MILVLASQPGLSVSAALTHHAATSWPWYLVRASGITALVLLVLLILSGIGQVTGLTYRFIEPVYAWAVHRALAIAMGISILIHGTFLLLDKYVPFNLAQVLIPFVSSYKREHLLGLPVGSVFVACGIVAAYAIAVIIISSLTIIDHTKRTWKRLHYLGYAAVVLIFFHALFTGTDFAGPLVRTLWIATGGVLLVAMLSRLRRAGSLKT